MLFEETRLSENIVRGVKDAGYTAMTDIQSKTIDPILDNKDIVAMSNTGSGKTAAFVLPLLNKIDIENKNTQVLVITPTRELALQIVQEVRKYTKYVQGINAIAIYGGQEVKTQAISLRKGVKIVCGTPGRIRNLLTNRTLRIGKLSTLVLDEADECFSMGFEEDINYILNKVPTTAQKLMFSATIDERVKNIAYANLNDPIFIESKQNNTLLVDNIKQIAIDVKEKMKDECVYRIIKKENAKNSIVFCNTKKKTELLYNYLKNKGIRLEMLNSDIRQEKREAILKKLKQGKLDTIVVTDVLARGIDVEELELVINYDIPFEKEYYVHRIGRTARKGNSGVAYTLYTGKQIEKLQEIEEYTSSKFEFEEVPVPSNNDACNIEIDLETFKRRDDFYIVTFNLGKDDSVKAKDFVGAMKALVGISSEKLGRIEVYDSKSTVEIPSEYITEVIKVFSKNAKIKTIDVKIINE